MVHSGRMPSDRSKGVLHSAKAFRVSRMEALTIAGLQSDLCSVKKFGLSQNCGDRCVMRLPAELQQERNEARLYLSSLTISPIFKYNAYEYLSCEDGE